MYRFKKGSGFPVSVPSVDLVEIGAGGGSLARIDQFGLLKVGPESAGAEPGPASYGRGGTEPAVTDADVVLGLLDPAAFLGGDMPLDAAAGGDGRRRASAPRSASTRPHDRRRHPRDRQPEHGRRRPDARRRAGHRPARRVRARVRRRRPGPRLRRGRAARLRPRRVPRQRQRAVGVRHAGVARAHRPRPLDAPPPRRRRPGRARRAARRAARRGPAGARRGRCASATTSGSATGSTPATPGRATR